MTSPEARPGGWGPATMALLVLVALATSSAAAVVDGQTAPGDVVSVFAERMAAVPADAIDRPANG